MCQLVRKQFPALGAARRILAVAEDNVISHGIG
jgi:hypothetical protein